MKIINDDSPNSVNIDPELSPWSYVESHQDHLIPPYIETYRSGYRWAHNPLIDDDGKPQVMQSNRPIKSFVKPDEQAAKGVWIEYAESFTLSNYVTEHHALQAYYEMIDRFRKRYQESQKAAKVIQSFLSNKGDHIVKVNYTPDTAIVGPINEKGHFDAILKEGVQMKDLVDKTYKPIKINIE